jgi:putative transposase
MANKLTRTQIGLLGRSTVCVLNVSGVVHRTHCFDSGRASALLRRNQTADKRQIRGAQPDRAGMPILCTWDPSDCSFIHIYDAVSKQQIRLPNVDHEYSKGLSWENAKKIRLFAVEQLLPFASDQEKHAARVVFGRLIAGEPAYQAAPNAREAAKSKKRAFNGLKLVEPK